jgi:hypothetical protein
MANYISHCRSNQFNVKDASTFFKWAVTLPWEVHLYSSGPGKQGCFVLICEENWPTWIYDDDAMDEIETHFEQEIGKHLVKNSICLLYEIGYEKMRYLCGFVTAINHKGDIQTLSLEDIRQQLTDKWGNDLDIGQF